MLHNKKNYKFHWVIWFPYPSSWLRALILVPIAFPGARLIFFIYAGATFSAIRDSPIATIFLLFLIGSLIPAIVLSFPYHFLWFIWQKKTFKRWFAWLPSWSSLWEGLYATFVIGLSFLLIIALSKELSVLSCQSP